jgi:nitric oxide reductase subunit C
MTDQPWWASESMWRKTAVFVTAGMFVILMALTLHSLQAISIGSERVPPYSVINYKIFYSYSDEREKMVPHIGEEAPLFGVKVTPEEAEAMVRKGKLTIQARNCMNCHTLLGNGAYFAPDLTKAWLDQGWGTEGVREDMMFNFLKDPATYARSYGSGRKMPNLQLTDEETRGVIAFLKWMSSIDTNGFPYGFEPISQEGE